MVENLNNLAYNCTKNGIKLKCLIFNNNHQFWVFGKFMVSLIPLLVFSLLFHAQFVAATRKVTLTKNTKPSTKTKDWELELGYSGFKPNITTLKQFRDTNLLGFHLVKRQTLKYSFRALFLGKHTYSCAPESEALSGCISNRVSGGEREDERKLAWFAVKGLCVSAEMEETNLLRLESYRDRQQQSMAAVCVRGMFFLSVSINCRIEDANGTD
jgi:hypothetical protein